MKQILFILAISIAVKTSAQVSKKSTAKKFNWVAWNKVSTEIKSKFKKIGIYNNIEENLKYGCAINISMVALDNEKKEGFAVSMQGGACCGTLGCSLEIYEDNGNKVLWLIDEVEEVVPAKNGVITSKGKFMPYEYKETKNSTVSKENRVNPNPATQSNSLLPGAEILFKDVKTKISDADKNDIFLQTGFYYNLVEKKITPAKGISTKDFLYEASPTDMNKDRVEEILVFQGLEKDEKYHVSVYVFINKNGKYYKSGTLTTGSSYPEVFASRNYGYNDIGVTSPIRKIYRFDGIEYKEYTGNIGEVLNNIYQFSLDYTSPLHTITNPSIVTKYVFRNIKTKLTEEERKSFAEGLIIQYRENEDTSLKYIFDETVNVNKAPRADLQIFPTDLNKDGVEEIFTRLNSTFLGPWLAPLDMYIKGKDGKYLQQDFLSEDDISPRLLVRATGNGGYPDLIGSSPEGPGFYKVPTKFDVYRWDGTNYKLYKHNQPYQKTDRSIEEQISPAYQATLPDSLLKKNIVFDEPQTKSSTAQKETTAFSGKPPSIPKPTEINTIAASLFTDVKTKLTIPEKNRIAYLTGIKEEEINAKTKKGKPKHELNIYPLDLNKDGTEEIILCVTTKPLGIPMHTYFLYTKNYSGSYQAAPGKIGQGVKILLNGKTDFPDLITGTALTDREVWSWTGQAYRIAQTIPAATVIPFKTVNIDDASKEYSDSKLNR